MRFISVSQLFEDPPNEEPSLWGEGLLPERSLTVLHSASKQGKSIFTCNLALLGAMPKPPSFLGFPINRHFRTVIHQKEVHQYGMYVRFKRMVEHYPGYNREWLSNVKINDCRAERLSDLTVFRELLSFLRDERPDLLVLDPLSHLLTGEENDNALVGQVLERLETLRDDPGCAVLLVHHDRKSGKDVMFTGGSPQDAARGAGRIIADSDSVLSLSPRKRQRRGPVSQFGNLGRYGSSVEKFMLLMDESTFWFERLPEKGNLEELSSWVSGNGGAMSEAELFKRMEVEWGVTDRRTHLKYAKQAVADGYLMITVLRGKETYLTVGRSKIDG